MQQRSTRYASYVRAGMAVLLLATISSCKKDDSPSTPPLTAEEQYLKNLVDYKASKHPIMVSFLVGDGNDPADATNVTNTPDSVDIIELFSGYAKDATAWAAVQKKGTRIVRCEFPSAAYFDHSAKDPATKVPGYVRPAGIDSTHPTASSTYEHYAHDKYSEYITQNKWDGIDVDIESGTFGGDVPSSNAKNFLTTLSRYFGPKCTECDSMNRKKAIMIYDTDVSSPSGNIGYNNLYGPLKERFDYVMFQAYIGGNRAWTGTGTQSFGPIVTGYGAGFLPLVNGDEFIYPDGNQDSPPNGDSKATASALSYAQWVKDNNGMGMGIYRASRDYNHTPRFSTTKNAIQIMNPAKP